MNNDPKIYRNNVDADIKHFGGQSKQLKISQEAARGRNILAKLDQGEVSAFEQALSRNGLVQTVEISALPSNWDSASTSRNITEQLNAFKLAKEEAKPSFSSFIGKLLGKEKEHSSPELSR